MVVRGAGIGVGVGTFSRQGIAALSPALTINGTTVYPAFRYFGKDADATNIDPAGYGDILPIVEGGTNPTFNSGSTWKPPVDDAVTLNGGDFYQASTTGFGDLTTGDIVVEAVIGFATPGQTLLAKWATAPGWILLSSTGANVLSAYMQNAAGPTQVVSGSLVVGTVYHVMLFIDRSGSAQWYVNGVASGAPVSMAGTTGTLATTDKLTLGARTSALEKWSGDFLYCAVWESPAWLDTHLQAALALERYNEVAP